jgi:hypothetical protein
MFTRFFIFIFASLIAVQSASAGYVLRFSTSAPVVSGVAQFSLGSSNNVELYLDATDADATALGTLGLSDASLGNPGVPDIDDYSAGVTLTNTVGNANLVSLAPNSDFDLKPSRVVGLTGAWQALSFDDSMKGTLSGSTRSILLGTFTINAGTTIGDNGFLTIDKSAFSLALNDPDINDDNDGNGFIDPNTLGGSNVFEFSAVPEPGAFALMGFAVAGGAAFLRRRKAATQPAAPAKE